jgi:signal transduction histidine kinase/HAMP domain-containing protein
MTPILTIISPSSYLDSLHGLTGLLGWLALLGVNFLLLWKWRHYNKPLSRSQVILLLALLTFTPLANLFLGVQIHTISSLPPPGIPQESTSIVAMIFSAIPWVLAAGLSGPFSAAALGLLCGLLNALWLTHNLFTPLEIALFAIIFSITVRQQYRTPIYRLLKHPFVTALLFCMIFPLFHLVTTLLSTQGSLVIRLDYALSNIQGYTIAIGVELLVAGSVAELISLVLPASWKEHDSLLPSPAENSLQMRFLVSMAPLALFLVLTLVASNWIVAGRAARNMIRARMENAAALVAENVPYFMVNGQSLLSQLADDPRLLSEDHATVTEAIQEDIGTVPFFNQLTVIDKIDEMIASYPTSNNVGRQSPIEEQKGIQLALSGVRFQTFSIPPIAEQTTAQISFVAALFDEENQPVRVLIGRSDLASNPFTKPVLSSLNNLAGIDGQGLLIDENGYILVHPDPARVMTTYTGRTADGPIFYEDTAPDGTRLLVYYQPAKGHPWAIVLMVPASRAQQLALTIATPLLGMIAFLSLVSFIILRLGLRSVTASLQNLASEAGRLAKGKLDQSLAIEGDDEVGQLRRAFEQMRASLKARLDELNRLLLVSQGVASSLEFSEAVQPVLESALATGASAARIVLSPVIVPELGEGPSNPVSFGMGPSQTLYREFDEQILALTRQQERLVLSNLYRPRLLDFAPGTPHPESLLAVALRHENLYYGSLWVAYDQTHSFSEEEVRFMVTLGGQAALAAANARLFLNEEIGRKRLESILASNPDPVLVTDQHDRLLLTNPAAWQVLDLGMKGDEGQPIDQVISEPELVNLLRVSSAEKQSVEITLPGGRVYLATATPVLAEGQRVGRVCVMRDVTYFKELDALKSEFVSTVSHDLRSPLTLMRGYATMLEMVGQLNEQQTSYVRKIVGGVENMSRLVNNLLDLGRIEAGVGLQLEKVSTQDIIDRVVSALQLQAAQKHIQLTTDISHPAPMVEADQALLQQAIQNLVENAIKYTRSEGKVQIRVQVQSTGVIFEVIDNGIGISPVDQPRLFEKFYRGAQQASKDQHGTGLGLAIVKSIAERHGGRVWAESQLGKGSIFYLSLPLKQSDYQSES